MKTGNIIVSALIGITIGPAAGILFAPASGQKTRRRILEKGEDLTDQMKENINGYLTKMKDTYEEVKTKTNDAIHSGQENYDELKKEINQLIA